MKHTTGWFSILLALWLMLILSLTGLYLLEYMVPFSRNVKGIENASKAFYQSYGALESSIIETYSWAKITKWYEPSSIEFTSTPLWSSSSVISSGSTIPFAGRGNSEIDSDWNQLSLTKPVSIFVWRNRLSSWANINLRLRIPNSWNLKWADDDFVIWQLSSQTWSLTVASGALISENDMDWNNISLWTQLWTSLSWSNETFEAFYSANCDSLSEECVLKISVINPLISDANNSSIPYLEYQISSNRVLPFQESYIRAGWKSYGFRKKLEVVLPHRTTSSAFDFTVLQ